MRRLSLERLPYARRPPINHQKTLSFQTRPSLRLLTMLLYCLFSVSPSFLWTTTEGQCASNATHVVDSFAEGFVLTRVPSLNRT